MHTMQEQGEGPHDAQGNGYMTDSPYTSGLRQQSAQKQPQMRDLLLNCLGMLLPLLAQAGHGH